MSTLDSVSAIGPLLCFQFLCLGLPGSQSMHDSEDIDTGGLFVSLPSPQAGFPAAYCTTSISPHLLNRIGWHSGGLVLLHLGLAWSALPTRGMQRRPTPSASTPGTACLSSSRGPCCRLPSACGLGAGARGDDDAPSTKPSTLIVSARVRLHLLYAVEKYRTVVIVGETGSGKSTQIPQVM